ncbi:tyrosine-protein phosphatase [Caulobacter sp. S45]|uniref:fused DSP-PTPase phosphatase/NAD kinase-like protein n=1 Tax=Caulobacter sp. S45 TaxID=1641861 RepID=UPI0015755ED4|nr:tyrosine-protein phosphatase [Caulobacter sp. S45]
MHAPGYDLSSFAGRARAYRDLLWNDHAYLRLGFQNAHWVGSELVRTNQPWPFQLRWWRDQGLSTVVNLRGGGYETGFYVLEREACGRLGLELVNFAVASRDAPSRAQVNAAAEMFRTIRYPALMHCKSGADRAGLMSVLYAHLHLGQPLRQAVKDQLGLRTLHIRQGKTGVLDYMFERYFAEGEPRGLSLLDWVNSDAYDHDALRRDFDAGVIGSLLTETLLRRE